MKEQTITERVIRMGIDEIDAKMAALREERERLVAMLEGAAPAQTKRIRSAAHRKAQSEAMKEHWKQRKARPAASPKEETVTR